MKEDIMQFVEVADHENLRSFAKTVVSMLTPKQMKELAPMFEMAISFNPLSNKTPRQRARQPEPEPDTSAGYPDEPDIDMSGMEDLR